MPLAREALDGLLEACDFGSLIGEVENGWFDAKLQPYQLQNEPGKRELAKDVAAFANADGGVIFIGARTTPSLVHYGDEVAEIRPFEQALVNTTQYRNVLDGWIYPHVEGLNVEWLATKTDPTRGIVVVRIPAQQAEAKPFIVVKTIHSGKVIETMFGYAERRSDGNVPMSVGDLQRAMRTGMNFERTMQSRLDGLEALVRNLSSRSPEDSSTLPASQLDARIEETLREAEMEAHRNLVLAAYPASGAELSTLFLSGPETIRARLERPPTLRSSGWDIETGAGSEIVRGAMVRSQTWRKTLSLYRDGTLIFACRADNNFLAWASEIKKFHPLALAEVVFTFVSFYELVIADFKERPPNVVFDLRLNNLRKDNRPSKLGPWGHGTGAHMFNDGVRDAPDDSFHFSVPTETVTFTPDRIAYRLLREVYFWFGFAHDKIPYVIEHDGESRIDRTALANA